ncbi:condensation domain-containing protein [Micromonospora sp. BRA006-A]|nr:condensation domain-containing protein [Micromonospora sp. BRA006-A]
MAALGDIHHRHQALHARYRRTDPPTAIIPPNPGYPSYGYSPTPPPNTTPSTNSPKQYNNPRLHPGPQLARRPHRNKTTNRILFGIGIHHIAFDGWSYGLLVRDLSHAYTARHTGHKPTWTHPAPTLHQSYDEHTRLRNAADLQTQRTYWREQLRDLPRQGEGPATAPLEQTLAWGPKAGHTVTVTPEVLDRWDRAARDQRFSRSSYFVAASPRRCAPSISRTTSPC